MNRNTTPKIYSTVLYLSGLFLFLEWLYPIEQVTDTNSITIFIIYTIFCFFISMLRLKWWISFLLKGFGLIFILNGLYFEARFLSREWFSHLAYEMILNMDILISQNWYYLTPFFRSFLFLLLIWLMSYLLYYWFVQMKRIFLFIVLTFVYVTVLDTFTSYDAGLAIIRIFTVSLIALAMANFNRQLEKEKLTFAAIVNKLRWTYPILLFITVSLLIGIFAPKFNPQWPDPVPFIESAAKQISGSGGTSIQKVGYGEDDSRLGGSFIQDDTPVFRVEAENEQYWRIETKDVYTGKGWGTSVESDFQKLEYPGQIFPSNFNRDSEEELSTARIEFLEGRDFHRLVYPYGITDVRDASHPLVLYVDHELEAIEARVHDRKLLLDFYRVYYIPQEISLNLLREANTYDGDVSRYLQLPESLPARVGELAREITESYETLYDKVRAVERYFSSNDFSYQTTGVAVPKGNEDYVDQFLFETKVGYCDNFSTAMVVMLRTLDIPARWVKGFTSGEKIGFDELTGYNIYEVTNANAHSWVEVFFQGVGWVPFEPTQGFTNPTTFSLDNSDSSYESFDDVMEVPEDEVPENDVEVEEEDSVPVVGDTDVNGEEKSNISWVKLGLALAIILLLSMIVYKYRLKIKTVFHSVKLTRWQDEKTFQDAYLHLLAVLDHAGYERKENQTLREYAKYVDARYRTNEMQVLTAYYERMLYRNEFNSSELMELKKLWKRLLKTIMG